MKQLTDKQRKYIACYDGDIKRSAKEAGISYQYAKELHTKSYYTHIHEKLKNRQDTVVNSKIMSRQERQEFWTHMAKNAERDADKLKASELLGKSEADFLDRIKDETGPRKIILKRQDDD